MTTVWTAFRQSLLLYNYWGNGDDFFVSTPALEYPAAIFLVFGLLWALMKIRDERAQFLLLGLVVNAIPGVVSKPNMNRDIGTMPFIYFLVALGVMFFAQQLVRLVPRIGAALAGLQVEPQLPHRRLGSVRLRLHAGHLLSYHQANRETDQADGNQ